MAPSGPSTLRISSAEPAPHRRGRSARRTPTTVKAAISDCRSSARVGIRCGWELGSIPEMKAHARITRIGGVPSPDAVSRPTGFRGEREGNL